MHRIESAVSRESNVSGQCCAQVSEDLHDTETCSNVERSMSSVKAAEELQAHGSLYHLCGRRRNVRGGIRSIRLSLSCHWQYVEMADNKLWPLITKTKIILQYTSTKLTFVSSVITSYLYPGNT